MRKFEFFFFIINVLNFLFSWLLSTKKINDTNFYRDLRENVFFVIFFFRVIYACNLAADRSVTRRTIGRIVAVTDVTCWAGADAIVFITARGANLRRNAWTTRTAVFRARASTMAARPRLPSTATATPAGSVRVARKVSFTAEIPFENFSRDWDT